MYKNKIVAIIKQKNKPALESKDTSFIKYNSYYSLFVKNLDSRDAYIEVLINNKSVTTKKILLKSKSSIDLHKFEDSGHSFLFIEKTLSIQNQRESLPEDGLIVIKVYFQKNVFEQSYEINRSQPLNELNKPLNPDPFVKDNNLPTKGGFIDDFPFPPQFTCSTNATDGITVPGKISDEPQDLLFENKYSLFLAEVTHESFDIVLNLEELEDGGLSADKKKCPTCKKKFKHKFIYCPYDATFLL